MKHQNDYNYGKRNMLAYACSTLYQHFKTWVDDRIKTAPVTNNISVIAQTGPKSTQIRSKPTLFNGNDQHKATLESIVAQQAQQQRGFAIN